MAVMAMVRDGVGNGCHGNDGGTDGLPPQL